MYLFHIDVSGLDEAEEDIQKMVHGLTASGLNEWSAKVLEEARSHIPAEKRDTVQLQFSKKNNKIDTTFHAPPEYAGFVTQAIETYLAEMPITTQQLFRLLLERIQKQENEQTNEKRELSISK